MSWDDDVKDADWRRYAKQLERPRRRVASPGAYSLRAEATEHGPELALHAADAPPEREPH